MDRRAIRSTRPSSERCAAPSPAANTGSSSVCSTGPKPSSPPRSCTPSTSGSYEFLRRRPIHFPRSGDIAVQPVRGPVGRHTSPPAADIVISSPETTGRRTEKPTSTRRYEMTTNIARSFARYIALPIVSAGILGGAALGLAGMANAATVTTETQHGLGHRGLTGHLREARAERAAGLAPPPRCRSLRHVQPVGPQLNEPPPIEALPGCGQLPGRASLVCTASDPQSGLHPQVARSRAGQSARMGSSCRTYRRAHGNRTAHRASSPQARRRGRCRIRLGGRRRQFRCRTVALAARRRYRRPAGVAGGRPRRPRPRRRHRAWESSAWWPCWSPSSRCFGTRPRRWHRRNCRRWRWFRRPAHSVRTLPPRGRSS